MRKKKTLGILLGVLAGISVITFAVSRHQTEAEKIKNSDEIILSIDPDTVTALSWETDDSSFSFSRENSEDAAWSYAEDSTFPINNDRMQELLENFREFGVSFIIEDVEDSAWYGLDNPTCTIRITSGEEETQIQLGDYSTMDSERYVSIGDGQVYLASHDLMEDFDLTLDDLIQNDDVPDLTETSVLRFSGLVDLEVRRAQEETVGKKSSSGSGTDDSEEASYAAFTDTAGQTADDSDAGLSLDSSRVRSYLDTLSYLNLTDHVTWNVTQEELEDYGLTDPELTITARYPEEDTTDEDTGSASGTNSGTQTSGKTTEDTSGDSKETTASSDTDNEDGTAQFILHIGRNQEKVDKARQSKDENAEEEVDIYARVDDSPLVYKITWSEYSSLIKASYNDLRSRELLRYDTDEIKQIDITLDGETCSFTAKGKGDDRKWYFKDEETDLTDLVNSLQTLQAPDADSFTDTTPTSPGASEKEEIAIRIYLEETGTSTTDDKQADEEIILYRYDGSTCLSTIDGTPFSFVNRSEVVDLIEAVHAIIL